MASISLYRKGEVDRQIVHLFMSMCVCTVSIISFHTFAYNPEYGALRSYVMAYKYPFYSAYVVKELFENMADFYYNSLYVFPILRTITNVKKK